MKMNLPNKLTSGRMCAIPVVIIISLIKPLQNIYLFSTISVSQLILLVVFVLASITDYLDGDLSQYEQIDNRVTLLY